MSTSIAIQYRGSVVFVWLDTFDRPHIKNTALVRMVFRLPLPESLINNGGIAGWVAGTPCGEEVRVQL